MVDLHTLLGSTKAVMAAAGGMVGCFFGAADGFLLALIAFTVADYISGVLAAIAHRELSSAVGFTGIAKKILIFTLVGLAHILDTYLLQGADALRMVVIFFYISNEGISLIENATRLGLPVPPQIQQVLRTMTTPPTNPTSTDPPPRDDPPPKPDASAEPYKRRH